MQRPWGEDMVGGEWAVVRSVERRRRVQVVRGWGGFGVASLSEVENKRALSKN